MTGPRHTSQPSSYTLLHLSRTVSHSHITEHPSITSSFWFWTNFTAFLVLDGPLRIYDCIITVMDPITDRQFFVCPVDGEIWAICHPEISFYEHGMYPRSLNTFPRPRVDDGDLARLQDPPQGHRGLRDDDSRGRMTPGSSSSPSHRGVGD